MADTTSESSVQGSKGFGKVFSRKVNRTRERFLQSVGKADRTQDTEFEENVQLFNTQQNAAQKLHKEIKNYINVLKAMQHASINIYKAIQETYEPNWQGYDDIVSAVEQLSSLWEDYVNRIQTEVQDPLSIYMSGFPDVRGRIAKRGRKLVDYDGLRHKLQAMENAKKRDEAKISKTRDDLEEAEAIYQGLNEELRGELPRLYDSRINFLASNFAAFFNVELKFEEESGKVKKQMVDTSEALQRANHKGPDIFASHTPMKLPISRNGLDESMNAVNLSRDQHSNDNSPVVKRNSYAPSTHDSERSTPVPAPRPDSTAHVYSNDPDPATQLYKSPVNGSTVDSDTHESLEDEYQQYETVNVRQHTLSGTHTTESTADVITEDHAPAPANDDTIDEPTSPSVSRDEQYANEDAESDAIYRSPGSNQPVQDVPFGSDVMYKVQATHMYTGEDTDELSFEPGDVICVIPWEDPEDADDGWLNGIKEGTKEKGVFPANFTKRM